MSITRTKPIITLLVVIATSACGTVRVTQNSEYQSSLAERVHTEPLVVEYSPAPLPLSGAELMDRQPYVEMNFSDIERQHVRVNGSTYSIPEEGLRLNLENLRDGFTYPLQGRFISDYGMRRGRPHTGIDIKAALGDTIRSVFDGVVRMSKPYSSYGNIVVVRHYNGLESVYSHNSRNLVSSGDVIVSGQPIALAGRTGRATTEHLHFEVRCAGEHFDPKLLVDPAGMSLCSGWLLLYKKGGRVVASLKNSPDELADLHAMADASEQAAADAEKARSEAIEASSKVSVTGSDSVKATYHTIKNGEVLGTIARKYGTTVSQLVRLNGLKSADRIRSGQKLRVK